MKQRLKRIFLYACRYSGIFAYFKTQNRHKIPVMCYHGVSTTDQHKFIPGNFIRIETFKSRIKFLIKKNYKFISLDQACEMVKKKQIPSNCIVLTIDDGYDSTFNELIPFLLERNIPITNYITTYKSVHKTPIFRLVLQYFFWLTNVDKISTDKMSVVYSKTVYTKDYKSLFEFIEYCEKHLTKEKRFQILQNIADQLSINLDSNLIQTFSIVPLERLGKFATNEHLDIQLHTHIHRISNDSQLFKKDLEKNKKYLASISDKPFRHFCYPSGIWREEDFKVLEDMDIVSATTCDTGLLDIHTHLYKIPRIIDSENMQLINIECEIVGFGQFLRDLKVKFLR